MGPRRAAEASVVRPHGDPQGKILDLIRERAGGDQADQAAGELPEQVDPERHADLLSKFGIDPQELLGGGLGDPPDKLGL